MIYLFLTDLFDIDVDKVPFQAFLQSRKEYIDSIKDIKRKNQSIVAWWLLEQAFLLVFGKKIERATQRKDGSWSIDNFDASFSIAHSDNLVCVGVSKGANFGVDIEKFADKVSRLGKRYSIPKDCKNIDEYLLQKFTEEESNYKCGNRAKYYYSVNVFDKKGGKYKFTIGTDKKTELNLNWISDLTD